ncbi:DUF2232 domain-containing protein [Paenibacillus thermoaerophilus]|uniref:DUF2232 domain-containing protein n=1 Tax=Paenibacillus thermoaerophilus TaxID=1215385 RepID=A0ABW2V897_9BACL|nr:DUF2232 domain-containing protein [Paenibacillus thermoaerophilus]
MNREQRSVWLWSGLFFLMLLLTMTFFAVFTVHVFLIPMVILFVRLSRGRFAAVYAVSLALACLMPMLLGAGALGLAAIIPALFFLGPTVVMGTLYKRRAPAKSVVTGGILAMLGQMLLLLVILTAMQVDVFGSLESYMRDSMTNAMKILNVELSQELVDQTIQAIKSSVPMFLIGISFYYAVLTHWISRAILNRMGEALPGMPPVREWMLPKSMVWIYLIALLLELVVRPDFDSTMYVLLFNLLPLLRFAFCIQGIAFLAFIAYQKRWSQALPVLVFVVTLLIAPLQHFISLLGVFDVAFPLRQRFLKR